MDGKYKPFVRFRHGEGFSGTHTLVNACGIAGMDALTVDSEEGLT